MNKASTYKSIDVQPKILNHEHCCLHKSDMFYKEEAQKLYQNSTFEQVDEFMDDFEVAQTQIQNIFEKSSQQIDNLHKFVDKVIKVTKN